MAKIRPKYDARVKEAFVNVDEDASGARAHVLDYINMLLAALESTSHAIRRYLVMSLAIAAVFTLLHANLFPQLSVGPIDFLRDSPVTIFLTTASAYFYLEAMVAIPELFRIDEAFDAAFAVWNKRAHERELHFLVKPGSSIYSVSTRWAKKKEYKAEYDKFSAGARRLGLVPVVVVPYVFQVYAFIALFSLYGIGNILVWLNLLFVAVLLGFSHALFNSSE